MNIKNYTSGVAPERTVSRIEELLCKAGATSIRKDYTNGEVSALAFLLPRQGGEPIPISMPVNVVAVEKVMREARKTYMTAKQREALREQAKRTAWKVMQDWLEVQLSLIQLGQVEAAQVFMPYMVTNTGETLYARLKASSFLALPEPQEESDK